VTAESEAKCRKIIRRLAKDHPGAEIVVMGCYATRAAEEVASLPGVVEVVADKRELPNFLARRGLREIPTGISHFAGRRRAYVKVQDGCRAGCSYCIVPLVRPHLASRPADDVLAEVRRLLLGGHREIVLTGVHLGEYGRDVEENAKCKMQNANCKLKVESDQSVTANPQSLIPNPLSLSSLLQYITALDGDFRVRLSSIEAMEVGPGLIELAAARPERICPHFHLPLQSGSDAVLKRMNRRYTAEEFIERCRALQTMLDRPALTTDVIVGFPGETDADFQQTCRVVEAVGFAKVHAFRFSPRQGTPAADMRGQVPGRIASHRAKKLEALSDRLRHRYFQELLGQPLQVMIEGEMPDRPGWIGGTSNRHASVALPGCRKSIGQLVEAVPTKIENDWLWV